MESGLLHVSLPARPGIAINFGGLLFLSLLGALHWSLLLGINFQCFKSFW